MKKAILIGFFLALVSPSCPVLRAGPLEMCWSDRTLQAELFGLKVRAMGIGSRLAGTDLLTPPVPGNASQNYRAWWIVLAVVLLILPLYLLFLIRQGQIMRKQIARLRTDTALLFDRAPCGYHSMDERGYFININNTLLHWLGYEKEEVIGKLRFTDVVAGESSEVEKQIAALREGRSSAKHMDFKRKNGQQISVIIREMTNGSESHRSNRLFSTVDNSDCKEALERIKNLDQELESFSYSISHDLRAPLRSIDGYSRILQEDYATQLGDEGKRVLTVIMTNAKRMGSLIDDLLEFGRLGRNPIQRSYINMTGMVNAIVHDLVSQHPHHKIHVKVGELHTAFADADMMRQVWLNLLDNAIKFTGKEGLPAIEVHSFKTEKDELCYQVKDNGVGFDAKYSSKLFGVFQRLHKIQDFAGTGVGLAIVKRIISRHGGRVWAEGSLQNGAVFYFTIPIHDEHT